MATPPTPPSPVRAVARVGGGRPPGGPWLLTRHRARQRIGRFRVEQFVVLELVLLGALAMLHRPAWQVAVGGVLGAALLLLAFLRPGGQWWLSRLAMRARLRRRARAARGVRSSDHRITVLRELSPALIIEAAEERGVPMGIGHDGSGWFAAAEIEVGSGGAFGDVVEPLSLGVLARTLLEEEFPVSAVQLVTHTVPAPTVALDGRSPCQQSYRELVGAGGDSAVAHQVQWLAVRLDDDEAADVAAERGGGTAGIHKAMASALTRCIKVTNSRNRSCRPLDRDELTDALVRSCGVMGTGAQPGSRRTGEEWQRWRGDGLAHAVYWVFRWPEIQANGPNLMNQLIACCGVENSLSIVIRRPTLTADQEGETAVDLAGIVRLIAEPALLGPAGDAFERAADTAGFGLRLLGGEQAPAVFATAPTGVPR